MKPIRQACPADYDAIQRFLEHAYGQPRDLFPLHYPSVWRRENTDYHHIHLLEEGSIIVSLVRIFPLDLILGGARVAVAGIGAVGTAPEHAGKGHMSRLMKHAIAEMKAEQFPISILWGDRHRYRSCGYETAGRSVVLTITKRGLEKCGIEPTTASRFTGEPQLAAQMKQAYERHAHRRVRRTNDFRLIAENTQVLTFCAGSDESFGYLAVFFGWSIQLAAEFGGHPLTVLRVARHAMERLGKVSFDFQFPSWNEIPNMIRQAASSWRIEPSGQIKILDLENTVRQFAPQLDVPPSLDLTAMSKLSGTEQVEALFGTASGGPFNVFVWPLDTV